ncbi:hypothetical protein [Kiloniella sp.]|uniref:hypothetical protein n=1 Tax=Kiloniella sp. TaxID=1938587 RepID=UPI003B010709
MKQKAAYREFLHEVLSKLEDSSHIGIYHHVRQIPYGGVGQRDPQQVYERNLGTCSGKHVLLRDLLQAANYNADVLNIFTHFNKYIPSHSTMSPHLLELLENGDVPDFHNIVQLSLSSKNGNVDRYLLDATWPDAMACYGFKINSSWAGSGDTVLAGPLLTRYPVCSSVVEQKEQLLLTLSKPDLERRAFFLDLLTSWISDQE